MKRSRGRGTGGMEEIKVAISSELLAALDDFARSYGLSRAEAARMALWSAPQLADVLTRTPVSVRDVVGP